ncbi:MAG: three-Cys-motif partner protein TcmP [Candidatus Thiodiazotropha sp. (ex Dulcina madagascariensis)]|nr:three-Cys-motif partner protein TcmP [Candidatus Thiodiazotropha sp. (ex Dulcina madagascariensis)]
MEQFDDFPDDGLATPEVGIWGIEKYRLISCYAAMFSKTMANKWDCIVYLDLFSGAGRARIKENNKIINSSSLIVLGHENKFSKYIFNDGNSDNCTALEQRIKNEFPDSEAHIFCEDANRGIEKILSAIPRAHRGFKVLSFCLVDIFKMDNLKFSTLSVLSKRYMDFLVLIPSDMDANRNERNYLNPENTTIDEFLGNSDWREKWASDSNDPRSFGQFIVDELGKSMGGLGFNVPKLDKTVGIKNSKNRVIYRLALYSKSKLAEKFWNECVKYTNPQTGFDF